MAKTRTLQKKNFMDIFSGKLQRKADSDSDRGPGAAGGI